MDVKNRIEQVLAAAKNDIQLDNYISDLRDSLATSNKLFIGYSLLLLTALVTYHLVVYAGATGIEFNSLRLSDSTLFRRVFLVVPAVILAAQASIGYLRRCQREVYDYLTISRYRILGQSGLHELRLPSDYILALFLLHQEGGFSKVVSTTVVLLSLCITELIPTAYVLIASYLNVKQFGTTDILCLSSSLTASFLAICGLVIFWLAMRIKA